MTVVQMRRFIEKEYEGEKWRKKVSRMSEGQVIAVYYRIVEDKKLKKKKGMITNESCVAEINS